MLKVGLILYSVRDEMAKDPIATVEAVARMGYRNIEVCNHNAIADSGCGFGVDAATLRDTFARFGSQVVSAHIFPMEKCDLPAVLAYEQTLGNRNIVNPNARFTTYDELMRLCEDMNRVGKICHENGMTYLYHNHQQEFRTFGGRTILDLICENTDPDYLSLELDTFWVMRANHRPVDMLRHYGKRVRLVHQKDFAWDSMEPVNLLGLTPEEIEMKPGDAFGTDGSSAYAKSGGRNLQLDEAAARARYIRSTAFTEIGTGIMDIQAIIDAANAYTAAEYMILEQDATRLPTQFDSIEKSMESFRRFSGISWDA